MWISLHIRLDDRPTRPKILPGVFKMSDYDSSSDDLAEELSLEKDAAINMALAKVATGEAINNEEISIDSEMAHESKNKAELIEQNNEALVKIVGSDPKDETDAFLKDFFANRKWEEKSKKPTKEEQEADDDLEEIDQGLEFEKRYNFRHEEKGFNVIPSNPRYVEGEDRVKETNRQKKRKEKAEKSRINEEEFQKKLDEIDEKYKAIADQNNGRLTDEQLHQYTDEYSKVLLEQQDGVFQYTETNADGGIEKSINILNANDDEENDNDDGSKKDKNEGGKKHRGKFNSKGSHNNRRGKLGKGPHKSGSSRMNLFFNHRH